MDGRLSSRSSFRESGSAATRLRQRMRMCSGGCARGLVSQEAEAIRQRGLLQAAEQSSLDRRRRAYVIGLFDHASRTAQLSAKAVLMENGGQCDPLDAPEPEEWLAIDEAERIHLAQDYHRRARVRLPNEKLHAVLHVEVENQIALGNEMPVQGTVQRLMAEGLDRQEAIHAIAVRGSRRRCATKLGCGHNMPLV